MNEPTLRFFAAGEIERKEFEPDGALEPEILGTTHGSHVPTAELLKNLAPLFIEIVKYDRAIHDSVSRTKNLLHRIATPEVHHNPSLLEASPGFVMGQCYGDSQRVSSNCIGHMWSRLRSLSALPKQQRKRQNDEEQLRTDEEARISRLLSEGGQVGFDA